MHQYFKYICLVCCGCIVLSSCQKEPTIHASPEDVNNFYTLPQGNHSYDDTIALFYDNYRSFILYKYDSVDYSYNITGPVLEGLHLEQADTMYISAALQYINKNLFNTYPKSFLQRTMPFKVLLAANIYNISDGLIDGVGVLRGTYNYSVYAGGNYVAFGLVNDSLQTMTGQQLDSTRGLLHMAYWRQAIGNNHVIMPPGFAALTDYVAMGVLGNNSPLKKRYGVFFTGRLDNRYDPIEDLLAYIDIITSTDLNTMQSRWFVPDVDVNGLYRRKYDLITSYYLTNYGIDLQAIGNLKNMP